MKVVELLNSITIPLTNEEWEVLGKFNDTNIRLKEEFNAREQMLANSLVKKDVLIRKSGDNGKIAYIKKIR